MITIARTNIKIPPFTDCKLFQEWSGDLAQSKGFARWKFEAILSLTEPNRHARQGAGFWHRDYSTDSDAERFTTHQLGGMVIGAEPFPTELLINGKVETLDPGYLYITHLKVVHRSPIIPIQIQRRFLRCQYNRISHLLKVFEDDIVDVRNVPCKEEWMKCCDCGAMKFEGNGHPEWCRGL